MISRDSFKRAMSILIQLKNDIPTMSSDTMSAILTESAFSIYSKLEDECGCANDEDNPIAMFISKKIPDKYCVGRYVFSVSYGVYNPDEIVFHEEKELLTYRVDDVDSLYDCLAHFSVLREDLCKALGVEYGEKFGVYQSNIEYWLQDDGYLYSREPVWDSENIIRLVNNVDEIEKVSTEEE